MSVNLVCPKCHGTLLKQHAIIKCLICQKEYFQVDGCIDFASGQGRNSGEKKYYDHIYGKAEKPLFAGEFKNKIEEMWFDKTFPSGKDILLKLGDLRGKEILCIGNGASMKEFYFSMKDASLWISDLSLGAVLQVKNSAPKAFQGFDVHYHAINALHLPFEDSSLDIVYGFAFVHHLSNKITFLKEVYRVLKIKGVCVFFDDAFCPIWQFSKKSALKPLMQYVHKKRGISPEDLRATLEGGFTREQIEKWGVAAGFSSYFFIRREFLLYFWIRGMKKIFNLDQNNLIVHFVGSLLSLIDTTTASISRLYQNNMIRLVWGYEKLESDLIQHSIRERK